MALYDDKGKDVFCAAREIKEKKKALYDEAARGCPDKVGIETFRMLKEAEEEHLRRIDALYEELGQGRLSPESCIFHSIDVEERKVLLRKIADEQGRLPKGCLDDVAAIETGLKLEDVAIEYFSKRLKEAMDPFERSFLERMIAEERVHYKLLADLKFYYVDPENWFLEKGRQRLDGAGSST